MEKDSKTREVYNDLSVIIGKLKEIIPNDKFKITRRRIQVIESFISGDYKSYPGSYSQSLAGEYILKTLRIAEDRGLVKWLRDNFSEDEDIKYLKINILKACRKLLQGSYKKISSLENKISCLTIEQKKIPAEILNVIKDFQDSEVKTELVEISNRAGELLLKIQYGQDSYGKLYSHFDIHKEADGLLEQVKVLKGKVDVELDTENNSEPGKILKQAEEFLSWYLRSESLVDSGFKKISKKDLFRNNSNHSKKKEEKAKKKVPVKPLAGLGKTIRFSKVTSKDNLKPEIIQPKKINKLPRIPIPKKTNILSEAESIKKFNKLPKAPLKIKTGIIAKGLQPVKKHKLPKIPLPLKTNILSEIKMSKNTKATGELAASQKTKVSVRFKPIKAKLQFSPVKQLDIPDVKKDEPDLEIIKLKVEETVKSIKETSEEIKVEEDKKSGNVSPHEKLEETLLEEKLKEIHLGEKLQEIGSILGKDEINIKSPEDIPEATLIEEVEENADSRDIDEEMTLEEKLKIIDDLSEEDFDIDKPGQREDRDCFLDLGTIEGLHNVIGMEEIEKILELIGSPTHEESDEKGDEEIDTEIDKKINEATDKENDVSEKKESFISKKTDALKKLSVFLNEKLTNSQLNTLKASIDEAKENKKDYTEVIEKILSEMPSAGTINPRLDHSGKTKLPGKMRIDKTLEKKAGKIKKKKLRITIVHALIYLFLFSIAFAFTGFAAIAGQRNWVKSIFIGKSYQSSQQNDTKTADISGRSHYKLAIVGIIKPGSKFIPELIDKNSYYIPVISLICYFPELKRQYEFCGKELKISKSGDFRLTVSIPKSDIKSCPSILNVSVFKNNSRVFKSKSLKIKQETETVYVPEIVLENDSR